MEINHDAKAGNYAEVTLSDGTRFSLREGTDNGSPALKITALTGLIVIRPKVSNGLTVQEEQ